MQNIELLEGNGQEIYIDPDHLMLQKKWIKKKINAIIMPDISEELSNPVYEAYKEFFKELYKKGYKVVTDSTLVSDDTFFFSPCVDQHINKTKEEYRSKKMKKVYDCLMSEGITEPSSISFPENSFPDELPPLPFVLKNELANGGEDKFLIETNEQIETLKRFYDEINEYSRKVQIKKVKQDWACFPDLEFDKNGKSNRGVRIDFVDYNKQFHDCMRIQKFVKTPTEYYTSLRVVASSSGDILAASLKYSKPSTNADEEHYGLFDEYLSDPESPYFLGNKSIVSNTVAGGNSILLDKDNYSELEQEILIAHGIDPDNATVPQDVTKACISVATNCSHEVGAIYGMDFIYDDEEKAWKYLEGHEYPMLYSYAEKHNLPYNYGSKDFYTIDQLLDMRIRMHALALTIQKKQSLAKDKQKQFNNSNN